MEETFGLTFDSDPEDAAVLNGPEKDNGRGLNRAEQDGLSFCGEIGQDVKIENLFAPSGASQGARP